MTTRPFRNETYKNVRHRTTNSPVSSFADVNQRRYFFPECEADFLLAAACFFATALAAFVSCCALSCLACAFAPIAAAAEWDAFAAAAGGLPAAAGFPAGDDFPCAAAGAAFASAGCDLDFLRPLDSPGGAASFSPFRFFSFFS